MALRHATIYNNEKEAFGKRISEFRENPNLIPKPTPGVLEALDGFAGAGGFSQALFRVARDAGYRVNHRIFNHWSVALDVAKKNLGEISVFNGAIQDLDPREVVPGGYLDIFTASPECIFWSPARGAKPINDQRRSTAAEILRFLESIYVDVLVLENVEQIQDWGALDEHMRPIKSKAGELYKAFLKAIRRLGYSVETFVLSACDYGDPTTRRRWYLIAKKSRAPIARPRQTHSKGGILPGTEPWVAARQIIDFATKGNSIFERSVPHVGRTLARIEIGFAEQTERAPLARAYVDAVERFREIVELYYAQVEPLPTEKKLGRKLTREEKAHVRAVKAEAAVQHRLLVEQIFSAPIGYYRMEDLLLKNGVEPTLEGEAHLLIGTMRPVDPVVTKLYGTSTTSNIEAPIDALTAGGRNFGLATPQPDRFLVPPNHGESSSNGRHASIDDPLDTVTTKNSHGLVEPMLLRANASDTSAWNDSITSINAPLRTVTTKNNLSVIVPEAVLLPQQDFGNQSTRSISAPLPAITTISRHGMATPSAEATGGVNGFIAAYYGPKGEHHRAPRALSEPLATQTGDNTFAFVEPAIVSPAAALNVDAVLVSQHTTYNENPCLDEPLVTASTRGAGYIAQPFIVSRHQQQAEHINRTRTLDEPVATATGSGAGYFVDPVIVPQHRGVETDSVDTPLRTVTGSGTGIAIPTPSEFVTPNFGERANQQPRTHDLDAPLPTVTSHGAGMLVSSDAGPEPGNGKPIIYVDNVRIELDILYRMLHREELLRAHSLSSKDEIFDTSDVSEAVAVKLVGNGVAKRVAMAVIREGLRDRFEADRRAESEAA